jgi:hypothetical protein
LHKILILVRSAGLHFETVVCLHDPEFRLPKRSTHLVLDDNINWR